MREGKIHSLEGKYVWRCNLFLILHRLCKIRNTFHTCLNPAAVKQANTELKLKAWLSNELQAFLFPRCVMNSSNIMPNCEQQELVFLRPQVL